MRLCRFDDDRLGLVKRDHVLDVSAALEVLPRLSYPLPPGDLLIAHLGAVMARVRALEPKAVRKPLASCALLSPVANPPRIIAAPVNYLKHQAESVTDQGISFGREVKTIAEYGLFLKSPTSLVGPSQGVALRFPDRRNDHEVELAVVIGKGGDRIPCGAAIDHIAGYAIGLDMTVRGTEDRSQRKSIDSYSVLGPWLVTKDEIADPGDLELSIAVGGQVRQRSSTRFLIFDVPRLIEYASAYYALHPGDVIMTGTPEGVAPVKPGDVMHCEIAGIGAMDVAVRAA
ncbi:MAG TPA: fumarylacetoacetate hydrolase family protein [Alphaproteobacteria bacterium]|nr:fumarylacetoacetate hydrolase family protein [Alphaproteobacteria bacterium]